MRLSALESLKELLAPDPDKERRAAEKRAHEAAALAIPSEKGVAFEMLRDAHLGREEGTLPVRVTERMTENFAKAPTGGATFVPIKPKVK